MTLFRIVFGFDVLVALVALVFLVWGLNDGSVSSFNAEVWLMLVAALAAILGGGWVLNAKGSRRAAIGLLSVLAAPGAFYLLFILLVVILQPRWN